MVELPVSNELESMYNKVVTVYHETPSCNLPWKLKKTQAK